MRWGQRRASRPENSVSHLRGNKATVLVVVGRLIDALDKEIACSVPIFKRCVGLPEIASERFR